MEYEDYESEYEVHEWGQIRDVHREDAMNFCDKVRKYFMNYQYLKPRYQEWAEENLQDPGEVGIQGFTMKRTKALYELMQNEYLWTLSLIVCRARVVHQTAIRSQHHNYRRARPAVFNSPQDLVTECEDLYQQWMEDPEEIDQWTALGVLWGYLNKGDGRAVVDNQTLHKAFVRISRVCPEAVEFEWLFTHPDETPYGKMLERLHSAFISNNLQYSLSPQEVVSLLDSQCPQQIREDVKNLLIALEFRTTRDSTDLQTDIHIDLRPFEEMHSRGVVSGGFIRILREAVNCVYSVSTSAGETAECSICYTAKVMFKLNACGHTACEECLEKVLKSNKKCHICRADLNQEQVRNPYKHTPLSLSAL